MLLGRDRHAGGDAPDQRDVTGCENRLAGLRVPGEGEYRGGLRVRAGIIQLDGAALVGADMKIALALQRMKLMLDR